MSLIQGIALTLVVWTIGGALLWIIWRPVFRPPLERTDESQSTDSPVTGDDR